MAAVVAAPRCKGVRVKTLEPCRVSKGLNADGFCKFHVPDAVQCLGRKASGERCRIAWDLNDAQLCKHHASQASATPVESVATPSKQTEEEEEEKEPAEKTTAAQKLQCRGIATSTRERCRITKGLNDKQLCKHHAKQTPTVAKTTTEKQTSEPIGWREPLIRVPPQTTQSKVAGERIALKEPTVRPAETKQSTAAATTCRGIAKTTGRPCRIGWELNAQGYCKYHRTQTPSPTTKTKPSIAAQCRGVAKTTNKQCRIAWDLDAHGFCKYHTSQHQHARL